jgi:maltose/moltooligosaccharide transporter
MNSNTMVEEAVIDTASEKKDARSKSALPKLSLRQLLNLCIGFIGIQFAWSMQIGLSGRVTEPLGATPLIFGLIWLAGPITGILVQPIVGVLSDNSWTKIGRRHPFLIAGTLLGSIGLVIFPNAELIANNLGWISPMLFAAAFLWIIDASVNISQGPYRALVPDVAPPEQHALANSFFSFAIGLGAVVAFGAAPFIKYAFGFQMSIAQQFIMGAIAFIVAMAWTVITTPEKNKPEKTEENTESALEPVKNFALSALLSAIVTTGIFFFGKFDLSNKDSIAQLLSYFVLILSIPMLGTALASFKSKEAWKLCGMQFFSWLGIMSMFIYFNNYVVHNIFAVPDLSSATEALKAQYATAETDATNISQTAFAIFNAVCLLVSIPLGVICGKIGKKNVHTIALLCMAAAFLGLGFFAKDTASVLVCMALAGIGWASVLALPFALLTEHIIPGTEGSAMGKFNLFIAGPQILSSVAVGYLITSSPMAVKAGMTHHWEYAFIVGGIAVIIAALITQTVKEKCKSLDTAQCTSGH